jgi:hypothetical protein
MQALAAFSRGLWLGLLILGLAGCASQQPQGLYHWGNFEEQIYARLKNTSNPQDQILAMEKTLHTNRTNRPLPPGFHAHLGLLYGETGNIAAMRQQFEKEKALYPEAVPFMDFLLRKFNAEKGAKK